jgi:transposase-like protein
MNRKKWTTEEKLLVVLAILNSKETVTEICHRYQVSATQAYRWRDQFLAGGKKALRDGRRKKGHDALVEENRKLKELVGSQALIIEAQKKYLGH